MKKNLIRFILPVALLLPTCRVSAQEVGVKTNLLSWATTTPGFGVEYEVSPKVTLSLSGAYNPWKFSGNKKIQHWLVMPEVRYFTKETFSGHFVGFHPFFLSYNAGGIVKKDRYEGYAVGGGFSYGYQWSLSSRWKMEATIGVGYAYLNYDRYECRECGDFIEKNHKHRVGPTKLGLSLIYLFNLKK